MSKLGFEFAMSPQASPAMKKAHLAFYVTASVMLGWGVWVAAPFCWEVFSALADAEYRRRKGTAMFIAALLPVVGALWGCIYLHQAYQLVKNLRLLK